jgi:plasmid stability protein
MATIQVRDIPEDTHRVFRQRAAAAGQSLQEYLRGVLIETAANPTMDEWLDSLGGHSGGNITRDDVVNAIRDDRRER